MDHSCTRLCIVVLGLSAGLCSIQNPPNNGENYCLSSNIQVRVYKNGGNVTATDKFFEGEVKCLNGESLDTLRTQAFDTLYGNTKYGQLWTGEGIRVDSPDQLQNGIFLYAVLPNNHFVWPGMFIGHKVSLDHLLTDRPGLAIVTLSISPRVFAIENFLSEAESKDLIQLAQEKAGLVASKVSAYGGKNTDSEVRNSAQAWLFPYHGPLVEVVDRRVANLSRIDWDTFEELDEDMQVVTYGPNQHYFCHSDFFDQGLHHTKPYVMNGTNRFITVYYYLQEPEKGGETAFCKGDPDFSLGKDMDATQLPFRENNPKLTETLLSFDDCPGMKVTPKRGRAILWYNIEMEDQELAVADDWSMHAGCDVLEGQKWGANKWIHNKPGDVRFIGKLPEQDPVDEELLWYHLTDKTTGGLYYYHPKSKTTQWTHPKNTHGADITVRSWAGTYGEADQYAHDEL